MPPNQYAPFLEENPELLYRARQPQRRSRAFEKYFEGLFPEVYGSYLTDVGRAANEGRDPNLMFGDFMGGYDFEDEWRKLSPWARGSSAPGMAQWNVPW